MTTAGISTARALARLRTEKSLTTANERQTQEVLMKLRDLRDELAHEAARTTDAASAARIRRLNQGVVAELVDLERQDEERQAKQRAIVEFREHEARTVPKHRSEYTAPWRPGDAR